MAMMWMARLICRFPARESRWRVCSPEDASMGAVPFQDAKWLRSGNLVMSPTSTRSRAADEGPIPLSWVRAVSYTHLDVYKRQGVGRAKDSRGGTTPKAAPTGTVIPSQSGFPLVGVTGFEHLT